MDNGHKMASIHRFLVRENGIEIGYNNFKSYVRSKNLKVKKVNNTPSMRYETPPAVQAQVDWKESMELTSCHGEVFKSMFLG